MKKSFDIDLVRKGDVIYYRYWNNSINQLFVTEIFAQHFNEKRFITIINYLDGEFRPTEINYSERELVEKIGRKYLFSKNILSGLDLM